MSLRLTGYAVFDFQEVMFVDVEVLLRNGSKLLRRTMVIKIEMEGGIPFRYPTSLPS